MHINTSHRHFIAAPLLTVALLTSFLLSSGARMTGALVSSAPEHHQILNEGTALVGSEGIMKLDVPAGSITGLGGGFHISQYSDVLTIAAITAPVILRTEGGLLLVPAGMQWRGNPTELPTLEDGFDVWASARHVETLPLEFIQEQMAALRIENSLLPAAESSMPTQSDITSILRFSEANERAEKLWEQRVFGHLRYLLEQGRIEEARDLLKAEDVLFASSPLAQSVFPILLARNSSDAGIAMELMSRITDEDVRTLSAIHPLYRDVAWTMGDLASSEESQLLRLLTLPKSDIAYERISELAVSKWLSDAEAHLASLKDPKPLLTELTSVLLDVSSRSSALGYPERSGRYRDAVFALAKGREEFLSADLISELKDLAISSRVSLRPEDSAEEVPLPEVSNQEEAVPAAASEPPANAAALESQVYGILKNAGALFTVETTIEAITGDTVSVSGILFSSASGDRSVSFTLTFSNLSVSHVTVDNERLPFGMALTEFLEWVKGS